MFHGVVNINADELQNIVGGIVVLQQAFLKVFMPFY